MGYVIDHPGRKHGPSGPFLPGAYLNAKNGTICRRVRIPYAPPLPAWTRESRMAPWVTCDLKDGNARPVQTPVQTFNPSARTAFAGPPSEA
jgi:hypothetical protein